MKKIVLAATILAIAGANLQTARAGDREWATAGKILTGVVAGAVLASAVNAQPVTYSASYYGYHPPVYVHPAPVYTYCPPPPPPRVVVMPAPVVIAPSPVIVYRTPVRIAPQPVVSVNLGYYSGPAKGHPKGRYHPHHR